MLLIQIRSKEQPTPNFPTLDLAKYFYKIPATAKSIVRSMGFGGVLFQWRSAETVYRHLHHPAKTINGFLCLLIVFLKSKTHQLKLKDVIKLNRNLR